MQKPIIQKGIYLIAFLLYVVLWILNENYKTLFFKSSIGLSYWIVDVIIIVTLLFQLFFNNKIVWAIILSLLLVHMVWTIINIHKSSNYGFATWIVIILLYLIAFAVMGYLYPKSLNK